MARTESKQLLNRFMFIILLITAFHLIFLSWLRQSLDNKQTLSPADYIPDFTMLAYTKKYFPLLQALAGRQLYSFHRNPRKVAWVRSFEGYG